MKKTKVTYGDDRYVNKPELILNVPKIGLIGKDGVITLTGISNSFISLAAPQYEDKKYKI